MVLENASLKEIQEFFSHDNFASKACGAQIISAQRGHAICELTLDSVHRNAMGGVMGGAIFTLADFALAIACNVGEPPTVLVSANIDYLSAARGKRLIAECKAEKSGRSLGFYTIEIHDEEGVLVARMSATCARKPA